MAYKMGSDRNQMMAFPPTLDQYVGQDHPVRAYDAFVDHLDLKELGIELDHVKMGPGQYDPRSMMKLLLYGYSYGVMSSRKLERELHNNISFIWLMKQLKPDHKTIAEFRRQNKDALKKALGECARFCLKAGLIDGNVLFLDSTKLRANAGKGNLHKRQWYQHRLTEIDERIGQILEQCEQADGDESGCGSLVKMPKELVQAKTLKKTIEDCLAEFNRRGEKAKRVK